MEGGREICDNDAAEEDGRSDGPPTRGLSPGMEGTMTKGWEPLALPWLRVRTFRSTTCDSGETGASFRFDPA